MMNIYERIVGVYPNLKAEDFFPIGGTILLQDDSNGRGPYIKEWKHPVHQKPTEDQLKGV